VAGGTTIYYSYDALGRRDTIQNNSNFALDEYFSSNWQVVEEDQQGAVQNQFVWSSVYVDALLEQDSGSSRWYAQQDANWNVTAMVTSNGTVANRFVYDPYGKGTVYDTNWNLQGALSTTWVYYFEGGRYDAITGLYNFQHRDLSPTLGRWMQEDIVSSITGDPNLYDCEGDNPGIHEDPTGRCQQPPPPAPFPSGGGQPASGLSCSLTGAFAFNIPLPMFVPPLPFYSPCYHVAFSIQDLQINSLGKIALIPGGCKNADAFLGTVNLVLRQQIRPVSVTCTLDRPCHNGYRCLNFVTLFGSGPAGVPIVIPFPTSPPPTCLIIANLTFTWRYIAQLGSCVKAQASSRR
jgi:RHS repeat-associated protein